jgi:mRNA-degrading endonuclease RelE of RelBE toxin-antitoxin system
MKKRVTIQWTDTAKDGLKRLPLKARTGIIAKADELASCNNPGKAHKPLKGPLQGYSRLTYGRYRAIYRVDEEELANDDVLIQVRILFVAVGIRRERDKKDVYKVAKKLVDFGLLRMPGTELDE